MEKPATAGDSPVSENALARLRPVSYTHLDVYKRQVQQRGECMGTYGDGEMLAFPLHLDNVRPLAEKHFCAIAACNLSDQTVVGGRGPDLDRLAEDALTHFPRKKPTRLKTEGAFHTFYMITACLLYTSRCV